MPDNFEETYANYFELNSVIEEYTVEKTRGAIFGSKCKWYHEGECSSKYFFALEKQNALNKTMNATYCSDGSLTYNSSAILKEQAAFYKRLYKSDGKKYLDYLMKPIVLLLMKKEKRWNNPLLLMSYSVP